MTNQGPCYCGLQRSDVNLILYTTRTDSRKYTISSKLVWTTNETPFYILQKYKTSASKAVTSTDNRQVTSAIHVKTWGAEHLSK